MDNQPETHQKRISQSNLKYIRPELHVPDINSEVRTPYSRS